MPRPTIQSLCDDVLYFIFLHALPLHLFPNYPLDINAVEPMNFAMVCRSWRAVVLSHSNLWGRITIDNEYNPLREHETYRRLLFEWVRRSRTSGMDITVVLNTKEPRLAFSLEETISMVLKYQSRLEHLDINIRDVEADYWRPLKFKLSPNLVTLRIIFPAFSFQSQSDIAAYVDFTACAASTNLHSLIIDRRVRWILPDVQASPLHFPNLRHLDISTDIGKDIRDFFVLLSACPKVIRLRINARPVPSTSEVNAAETIVLSCIEGIYVGSDDRAVTIQFLSRVSCPSLKRLVVYAPVPHELDDRISLNLMNAYLDFFTRSQPPLLSLTLLHSVPSSPSCVAHGIVLRDILRQLRSLERLALTDVVVDDELFEEMTFGVGEDGTKNAICPFLKEMRIGYSGRLGRLGFRVRQESVDAMVASRLRGAMQEHSSNIQLELPECDEFAYARK